MDHFIVLCFMFVMLSCLSIAALRSPDVKGLASWFSYMLCFIVFLSLSHVVSWVRCGTCLFVCFCCFTSHVNSYDHCGMVSSLNHIFSWAGLSKRLTSNLCTYFRL